MFDWHIASVSWLDNLGIEFTGRRNLRHTPVATRGGNLGMDSPNQMVRRFVHLLNQLPRLFKFHFALGSNFVEL